jgi:hypothetical protein
MVGCDSKPTEKIPTTAPTAIKQPFEVLGHLQYIGVRKDFKAIPVIAPTDPEIAKGAAWWFTSHSGDMGIAMSDDEIKLFGLEDLKKEGLISTVARKTLTAKMDEIAAKQQAAPPAPKNAKNAKNAKTEVDPIKEQLPPEMKDLDVSKLDFPQNSPAYEKQIKPAVDKHLRPLYNGGLYRLLKGVPTDMWGDIVINSVKQNAQGPKYQDVFLAFKGIVIMQVTVMQNENGTWGISYIQFKKTPRGLELMLKQAQANP